MGGTKGGGPPWRGAALAMGLTAVVMIAARVRFAMTEPLWFDETFSLAIAQRPDWASFWGEVYRDSNGPAYYLLLRLWTLVAGTSDLALRTPSLVAVTAAGLLPLLVKRLSPEARIAWGGLIFAWWGVGYFLDARCYGLLLAVSTAQCVAFAGVMERPGTRRALVWALIGALSILLHYYAVFLGLAQGLIYLGRHRLAALKTWPGVLGFLPAFAWIGYHAPRIREYASLGGTWHAPLDAGRALELGAFAFGPSSPLVVAGVAAILAGGLLLGRSQAGPEARTTDSLWLTAAAGGLAFLLMLGFGLAGAGMTPRYLIPLAPPLLLGVVLAAGLSARTRMVWAALVLLYVGLQARPVLEAFGPARPLPRYEFETGSAWLKAHGVRELVFVWDHELSPIIADETLVRVGGTFFDRDHAPVRVIPLKVDAGHDPNRALLAAARGDRPGLIWMFNRQGHTAAHAFAPAIDRLDPAWSCLRTGDGTAGSLACYRR